MREPLHSQLARAHQQSLFTQITGRTDAEWMTISETAPAGRLPLVMFAPVATAFESAMEGDQGRNTWRLDRYSLCPREQAAAYFVLLAGLGYQLSVIERAVTTGQPYTGEVPPGQAEIGDGHEPEASADDTEAGSVPAGEPGTDQGDSDDETPAGQPSAETGEDRAAA
jgi:hypothetical protein